MPSRLNRSQWDRSTRRAVAGARKRAQGSGPPWLSPQLRETVVATAGAYEEWVRTVLAAALSHIIT